MYCCTQHQPAAIQHCVAMREHVRVRSLQVQQPPTAGPPSRIRIQSPQRGEASEVDAARMALALWQSWQLPVSIALRRPGLYCFYRCIAWHGLALAIGRAAGERFPAHAMHGVGPS